MAYLFIALGGLLIMLPVYIAENSPRHRKIWLKIFYIAVCFYIIIGLWLLYDSKKQEIEAKNNYASISNDVRLLIRISENKPISTINDNQFLNTLKHIASKISNYNTTTKSGTSTSVNNDLKIKSKILSSDILGFILQRERDNPIYIRTGDWKKETETQSRYSTETMGLYSKQFAARVIATRNLLAKQGLVDQELDRFYEHPTNPIGIRTVGERIGALAEQLP